MEYTLTDALFILGRVLYGGYFLMNGINHFKNIEMLAGYAGLKGVMFPTLAVRGSGLFILVGGLGVALGVYPVASLTLIIIFLVLVSLKMHAYWKEADPNLKMTDMIQFQKNMALLGAVLMLVAMPVWILPLF